MLRMAIALFLALLFAPHMAAAEFVVLSSTEASVPPGSVIGDDQKITVAKNKTLQLIDKSGRTITLNGPHKGIVKVSGGEGKSKLVRALSSLIREYEQDAKSVGASRKSDKKRIEDTIDSKESAMVINISETGDYCLLSGVAPKVIRYHSEKGKKVVLTAIANGASQAVDWPDETIAAAWPDALPVSEGARFLVTQEGKDTRTLLTLHQVPDDAPTKVHLAVALSGKECIEQARLMLVHIRREIK